MHQRQLFLNYLAQTSDFPLALEIEKAEGVWLYSPDGKAYMDLIAGIGVSNVGHRHPNVVNAIKNQVDHYLHTLVYGEYVQAPQVQLAEALVQTLGAYRTPMGFALNNVYLTNSGAEAVEGAMKLAKRFTGRTELISCINAYHGSTQGALSLAGADFFKQPFRPLLPDIRHIHHGCISDLEYITTRTAAVVIEVISAESGIRVPLREYLQALRNRCTETGTLLIFDEIQTGFGRTGSFWAFEQFGIVPDVLLSAKGMGGGMPIGAFIAPQELMKVFKNNPILGHITTFGGHPVSAAASLATVQTILEEKLCESVQAKAELFRELLVHPAIREVRGHGLFMAVEFADFTQLKAIIDHGIENGVITDWFLFCDNSMRIAPPLTITEAEIRQACEVILNAVKAVVD
ncbi:aspartate aminotransferase family protein [Siphonobacter sp. SORGH_AS_0500]|uniref:aspartate aminotransferase family protein n=1 Tax=Siphonobacter sp. SORGH_AS_0500 TaxID=1864824 RepID=UPI000CC23580|nr:aminotransferase class III-fold pyridoxal phosphate-dependent enzyme [Siphonobacter sp. SORGH_AS_0500]PKK38369.1 aspartate aminotransferase family protein [Siphonobacter sp. SORGH_AS_0500]